MRAAPLSRLMWILQTTVRRASLSVSVAPAPETPTKPSSKIDLLVALLRSPGGTTVEVMMAATGWQAHSVWGAISRSIKKDRGMEVRSESLEGGVATASASTPLPRMLDGGLPNYLGGKGV